MGGPILSPGTRTPGQCVAGESELALGPAPVEEAKAGVEVQGQPPGVSTWGDSVCSLASAPLTGPGPSAPLSCASAVLWSVTRTQLPAPLCRGRGWWVALLHTVGVHHLALDAGSHGQRHLSVLSQVPSRGEVECGGPGTRGGRAQVSPHLKVGAKPGFCWFLPSRRGCWRPLPALLTMAVGRADPQGT